MEENIESEDGKHHHQHYFGEQIPQPADAVLELRLGRAQGSAFRQSGQRRCWRRSVRSALCAAAAHIGAHKDTIGALRQAGFGPRNPGFFSTGKVSPVNTAWLTKKSLASSTTPSAGIRLPAESSATSPGTTSSAARTTGWPSRSTLALIRTCARSCSAALLALYSCVKLNKRCPPQSPG